MPASALTRSDRDFVYGFHAMATPCEVRVETDDENLAAAAGYVVQREARRIEAKFSRYREDSVVGRINAGAGADIEIEVDAETAYLLDFAQECFEVSDGLFDITSGVLRRIWHFDGSDNLPTDAQIETAEAAGRLAEGVVAFTDDQIARGNGNRSRRIWQRNMPSTRRLRRPAR